jgi:hypothetical protein
MDLLVLDERRGSAAALVQGDAESMRARPPRVMATPASLRGQKASICVVLL